MAIVAEAGRLRLMVDGLYVDPRDFRVSANREAVQSFGRRREAAAAAARLQRWFGRR